VCAGGDFNVAVGDADFFNPDELRMAKQAGTTAEERASMRRYAEAPLFMTDAFRSCHPHATGQYTYWSQRARNRPRNRGLRLDYFLLSSSVMAADALRDVQHRHELEGSDHCPVVVELELGRL
jgi:exodeoxyribonuclease III